MTGMVQWPEAGASAYMLGHPPRVATNRQNPLERNGKMSGAQADGNFCKRISTAMSSLARFSPSRAWSGGLYFAEAE